MLVVETEFASTLHGMERPGNTLSAVLRKAWDSDVLAILTKNWPVQATGSHVSIIGHITSEELTGHLNTIEMANGFMNRFLVWWAQRSQKLPRGGQLADDQLTPLAARVRAAVEFAP